MSFTMNNQLVAVTSSSEVAIIQDCNASSLPTGYLYCNGDTVNTSEYPELAAALGESGATFDLPFLVNEREYSLTVTGTNWTTTRAVGVPYITDDGIWRLRFNISGELSVATDGVILSIDGATFKSGTGHVAISAWTDQAAYHSVAYANPGTSQVVLYSNNNFSTNLSVSGDVELDSKPSFVLDNSPTNYDVYKVIRYAPKTALQGVSVASVTDISSNTPISLAQIANNDIFNVTTGSSANVTITLPEGDPSILYKKFSIIKYDSGTKFVEIARSGSDTIRGSATSIYAIQQNEAIELMWNGTEYQLLSDPDRIVRAYVSFSGGTPSVVIKSSEWISGAPDDNGNGNTDLNYNTGVFLSVDSANVTSQNASIIDSVVLWTTYINIKTNNTSGVGTDTNYYATVTGKK